MLLLLVPSDTCNSIIRAIFKNKLRSVFLCVDIYRSLDTFSFDERSGFLVGRFIGSGSPEHSDRHHFIQVHSE